MRVILATLLLLGTSVLAVPPREVLPPFQRMDFGPALYWTYQVAPGNITQKGIAVRLDDGSGGVSNGRAWMVYDHDTMRVADANAGWVQHEAVRDVDVYIEQPCLTYGECPAVRRQIPHPFVLDENDDDLGILLRAKSDLAMDMANLKISKLGGLTKIKQARDP